MSGESFNTLVSRLEVAWSDRPEGLLKQTVWWVVLGYVTLLAALFAGIVLVIAGVVIAVVFQGVVGTVIAALVALVGLLTALFISGSLWVRFDPPHGIELTVEEHPDLHALIAETGRLAGGVRFQRVMLDGEMNASVVQNPRLGVLGWYRSYLVIGLPLMESLSTEELQAVLAHEFAHVAGADGKTGAWLHRTRATWERVVAHMSAGPYCPLLPRFFNWFWPRFNSRAFLLSRLNELAADRVSAATVSASILSSGLQRLAVQGERLEDDFWDPMERMILGSGPLPENAMEQMATLLRAEPAATKAGQWLQKALAKTSGSTDCHPALSDRLKGLGCQTGEGLESLGRITPVTSSAEELLRPAFTAKARAIFSREWLAQALKSRESGIAGQEARLHARSVKEAWNRIAALCRLDGLEKIQPEVLALLERRPNHSGALFLRGCHLADKGDPASTKFLEQAAADPTLSVRAYEMLARFHSRFGRTEETASLKERAERHERELRAALVERSQVTKDDSFLPHDLCSREIESLRRTLDGEVIIRRAWAGARQVNHFPSWRHLVLVLDVRWPAFKPVSKKMQEQLISKILESWEVDGYVHAVRFDENTRPILRSLRRGMADSEVYRRR